MGDPHLRLAQGLAQAVFVPRHQDQVHVVRHQAIGPDRHPVLGQELDIGALVPVVEEGLEPPVAPLGHVMRDAGNHDAGETGHGGRLARRYPRCREISILSLDLVHGIGHCPRNSEFDSNTVADPVWF